VGDIARGGRDELRASPHGEKRTGQPSTSQPAPKGARRAGVILKSIAGGGRGGATRSLKDRSGSVLDDRRNSYEAPRHRLQLGSDVAIRAPCALCSRAAPAVPRVHVARRENAYLAGFCRRRRQPARRSGDDLLARRPSAALSADQGLVGMAARGPRSATAGRRM